MLKALDLPIVRASTIPVGMVPAERAAADTPPEDGRIGTLFGYSTVFSEWYEVNDWMEGNFLEQIDPRAADQSIAEDGDSVKIMFNHGRDVTIGMKALAVHDVLRADKTGVRYEGGLFDTSYNRDLLPGLRAGAYGSSFMFQVRADAWNNEPGVSDHNPKGIPERTITNFRLLEHGPVTFPANPAATSGARCVSTTDDFYRSTLDPAAYEALADQIRSTRDATPGGPDGGPGTRETAPVNHGHDNVRRLLQRTPI